MTPVDIGILSVVAIVGMIYFGVYIPIALGLVSFVSIWIISGKAILAFNFLKVAVGDGVTEYEFATIPLFTVMGLLVSKAGRQCSPSDPPPTPRVGESSVLWRRLAMGSPPGAGGSNT